MNVYVCMYLTMLQFPGIDMVKITSVNPSLSLSLPPPPPPQALVQKGEKRHIFSEIMPAVIQRGVNEENLQFMQHRDVYSPEYFDFVLTLVVSNMVSLCL